MRADDMILISVDDHIAEPADMFEGHVPAKYRELAPRVVTDEQRLPAVVVRRQEGPQPGPQRRGRQAAGDVQRQPVHVHEMRPGCFDVHERVRDMSAGGTLAGLNFPNWTGFSGQVLNEGPDRAVNEIMIKAYNDWHVDEWCAAYPDRFIPCGILPLFDVDKAAQEVRRLADKGCHAVTFSENPAALQMPSIHSGHWDPLFAAVLGRRAPCCASTSARRPRRPPPPPTPRPRWPWALSSVMSIYSLGDLMWAGFLVALPRPQVLLTEGDIGWIPYFLQRAEHIQDRHSGWTQHQFPDGMGPADVFRERILCCFINDPVGVSLIDHVQHRQRVLGVGLPALGHARGPTVPRSTRCSSPRSPTSRSTRSPTRTPCGTSRFDPFAIRPKERCTAEALRAEAADVDTVTRVGRAPDQSDRDYFKSLGPKEPAGARVTAPRRGAEYVKFGNPCCSPERRTSLTLGTKAEEAGFTGVAFADHLVTPERIDSPYPYTEDGKVWWTPTNALARSVDRRRHGGLRHHRPSSSSRRSTCSPSNPSSSAWRSRCRRRPSSPTTVLILGIGGWVDEGGVSFLRARTSIRGAAACSTRCSTSSPLCAPAVPLPIPVSSTGSTPSQPWSRCRPPASPCSSGGESDAAPARAARHDGWSAAARYSPLKVPPAAAPAWRSTAPRPRSSARSVPDHARPGHTA